MKTARNIALALAVMVLTVAWSSFAKTERSHDAWVGIYTQTVDHELAKAFNLKSEQGVVINEVVEDSPADKAGLKEEDVILSANGTKLESADDLTDAVEDAKPGDKMTFEIIRDGKEMTVAVTLGEKSDSFEQSFSWHGPKTPAIPRAPKAPTAWAFNFEGDGSFIGVSLYDLSEQLGDYFGVKNGNGVLVTEVERESPAEKGGIKAGDVIVGIDGDKVADSRDVSDMIQDKKPGSISSIDIIRDHKPTTVKVEVERRKGNNLFGYSQGFGKTPFVTSFPRMRGLKFSDDDNQMPDNEELREQMEELRNRMDELRDKMSSDKELQEQMRQLKEELKELKTKLH